MYSKHFVYILYNLRAFYNIGKTNKKIISDKFKLFERKGDISSIETVIPNYIDWDVLLY